MRNEEALGDASGSWLSLTGPAADFATGSTTDVASFTGMPFSFSVEDNAVDDSLSDSCDRDDAAALYEAGFTLESSWSSAESDRLSVPMNRPGGAPICSFVPPVPEVPDVGDEALPSDRPPLLDEFEVPPD